MHRFSIAGRLSSRTPRMAESSQVCVCVCVCMCRPCPTACEISSPTRDRTCAPCSGSAEYSPLDDQGIPRYNIKLLR